MQVAESPADRLRWHLLIAWTIASLALTLVAAWDIALLAFPDPDDAMRLLEVRDWLGGQSWWDVGQHRFNHGFYPMHWSRLVDLPLAAFITVLDPLVGPAAATRVTMVVVPLLTLLAILALIAFVTRRVAGEEAARLSVLVAPLSVPLIYQARPMRIDHHGWQIVLALAAVALLLDRATARRGALTGLALAALLTISLEGLPIAAAIAGVAALAWAFDPRRRDFLLALMGSWFLAAVALHVATRGPAMWAPVCDAIAPAWLATLGVAALGIGGATLTTRLGLGARVAALGAAGLAAAITLLAIAPACAAGPFATLPPLAYRLWYLKVSEGLPIWHQTAFWGAMTIGLPIVGLASSIRAYRDRANDTRARWLILTTLLGAGFVLSLLVNRTGATANALAVPGASLLLATLLGRARAIPHILPRLAATTGALLAASPGQAAAIALVVAGLVVPDATAANDRKGTHRVSCGPFADMRVIDSFPAGLVFAPIDISPDIIATTHHHAIGGGYHRGIAPMETVMRGFGSAPDRARAIILASGADYVAACPGASETELYRTRFPGGLWARLERGERFSWLQPIHTDSPALAWRVVRPLPSGSSGK